MLPRFSALINYKLQKISMKSLKLYLRRIALLSIIILSCSYIIYLNHYSVKRLIGIGTCVSVRPVYNNKLLKSKMRYIINKRQKIICPKKKYPYLKDNNIQGRINDSDCSQPYVTVNTEGSLGNQICQYLSLSILKYYFGVRVAILPEMFNKLNGKFYIKHPLSTSKCFSQSTVQITYRMLYNMLHSEAKSNHTPYDALKLPFHARDFPCPIEVLIQHRDYFRNDLKINETTYHFVKNYLYNFLEHQNKYKAYKILVSVHVRRNDYFRHMKILYKRSVLTTCYYINAFNYFREKYGNQVLFVVSSDDLPWCEAYLNFPDVVFPGKDGTHDPLFDFILLSLCDHHIVGLGTFGFLSAFYGQGTIMHPLVDTDAPSETEESYICSHSDVFIPMLDRPLNNL